jgi:hypothetical protein
MNDQPTQQSDLNRPETLAPLIRLIADRAAHSIVHKTKICFLLGAGADISAGGLTFTELKRQAVAEFLKRYLFDVTSPEEIEAEFEGLFLRLEPDERALLIESLFRRMEPLNPSDAYKLLVLLAEAGGVDAVITTNFDLMLERAQSQLGRDLFQVFAPGFARPYPLSFDRFELPKKPYLKLHGDIASRSVTLLTSYELKNSTYDSSMLELLVSILRTHDLVLAGYSGYDEALARIIVDAVDMSTNRIFWCNPHPPSPESPLYSQIADRARVISIGFDELMMEVARPVLEQPSLVPMEPMYLRCLFDWRVDYCNREYIHTYGERSGRSHVDIFARRRVIENRLASFLRPNRPLAIIAGPSGFGKTTIGIRLHKIWHAQSFTQILLIRSQALPSSGDIEQHISEQLGGLGSRTPFSLFQLERWLRENDLRLVLFIDGINEFSADLDRCVQLFRNILRFCYFLPEADSALRVITTIRQETWNAMLPYLDVAQLRKTLWVEGDSPQSISTIACGEFTDEELHDALARLRDNGYASIDTDRLTPTVVNQLRDPYLMGMIAEVAHKGLPPIPSAGVYQRAFDAKLQRRGSFIDIATLKDILASVALQCLGSQQDRFRESDIQPALLRGDIVRLMKDLHVFVDAGNGFLQFDHDRTLEYFIALGLASGTGPSLETIEDLLQFLQCFKTQGKPIAAARLYFQMAPAERFSLISTALRLLDSHDSRYGSSDRELLFGFAREVLVQMAEQGEPLAEQYLSDAIDAARSGRIGEHQLRTVVQAAASLPIERAIPLLAKVAHATSSLASTEADIYATDKLVKHYLLSRCPSIDLLRDDPYATFFADTEIAPWQRLGRLLGFAEELGPDNTHPDEYASILNVLNEALNHILHERPWSESDATTFAKFFLENCDRLLFNATPPGIKRFFGNPRRSEFEGIVNKLADGGILSEDDLLVFEPYTQSLAADIEYHLSHVFFILSSFNDLEATLRLAEERFATFSNNTPPEEIDFFHAVLVYLHILHNLPYDEARFKRWEEVILREWPDVLLYRPGLERGERRGFQDLFDRVFEDGFGVIYPYGVLSPSARRRRSRYIDYRRGLGTETSVQLPLYTKYLEEFLDTERIEEGLQIMQALGGVISAWPIEGLLTLRDVIGYPEPRVRRATVRLLAEAFNRHPDETMVFLKTSGAAISDEDLIEIKIRQDARIGRGQVAEEEWARIGHFLFKRPGARNVFVSCIRALLHAPSFENAVLSILHILGFMSPTGR